MIEIFDPAGVDYYVERARRELAAAKAAALLKARAAHLAIAARHIETVRNGGPPVGPRESGPIPLQVAFAVTQDDGGFDDLLGEIDAATTH